MSEERKLMFQGYPIEDAITLCNSARRTGELESYINKNHVRHESRHACTCGGAHKCVDCPNRNV